MYFDFLPFILWWRWCMYVPVPPMILFEKKMITQQQERELFDKIIKKQTNDDDDGANLITTKILKYRVKHPKIRTLTY